MLRVKVLAEGNFRVVAVIEGDDCLAESFLLDGQDSTKAYRLGLTEMLHHTADRGLQNVPAAWFHEVDKERGIYEFIKGPLRLFFFKGKNGDIAVCTSGTRKNGRKVDKKSVDKAAGMKSAYMAAVESQTIEVIENEDEQENPDAS